MSRAGNILKSLNELALEMMPTVQGKLVRLYVNATDEEMLKCSLEADKKKFSGCVRGVIDLTRGEIMIWRADVLHKHLLTHLTKSFPGYKYGKSSPDIRYATFVAQVQASPTKMKLLELYGTYYNSHADHSFEKFAQQTKAFSDNGKLLNSQFSNFSEFMMKQLKVKFELLGKEIPNNWNLILDKYLP